ncbi:glycoside hydrolase family 9 protein [Leifsonia sp. ZF2019]|uniref:glycoside hydrolase family 9 protein n=1 Tax=Leifsonia sp. ZF2019 TaxID=2781978 RepID=UPI001CBFE847|nr:glycoside hydrolase family 9 protein [Leifsonia sp. ZF2019]UAJ80349.1 glycoside hydrolase family 9 protein [Leifsonia sp. ZF2019]
METVAGPAVLVSQLGYNGRADKAAVIVGRRVAEARVETVDGDPVDVPVHIAGAPEPVAHWSGARYARVEFSGLTRPGHYRVIAEVDGADVASEPFAVAADRLPGLVVADITAMFRAQRSSGEIERKDAAARFYDDDSGRTVDARGGWLDASGDYSKFLSHLTYTRMMSPQQIPLCAWALLTAGRELRTAHPAFRTSQYPRLRDEGLFGADFLVRFQDPAGFFYTGIFDALTKRLEERVITAPLQDSVRTRRWQAAYRHGGGLAIAALALASTADEDGDYSRDAYFDAAERGFDHLERHNREYLFDGEESAIDDYCALLAAAELAHAAWTRGGDASRFVAAAHGRAAALAGRVRAGKTGAWLVGDVEGRPFFHAAEPGLPAVALLRWAEVLRAGAAGDVAGDRLTDAPEQAARAEEVALTVLSGMLERTDAVANPFGYPRQRIRPLSGADRDAFFFPHENETGYWWQGENAGISSLAYAATVASRLPGCDDAARERLRRLHADVIGWVGGLNPFDACMLQGRGRNGVEYSAEYQNTPGGIVNGITSGWEDEESIAFLPAEAPDGEEWRWAEQWIPHSGWFLLAVCAG